MAWEHAGVSANILTYRNAKADPAEWADVLIETLEEKGGMPGQGYVLRDVPIYHVTLYRHGVGQVGRKVYRPRRAPNPQALSPRMVGRLAKQIREEAAV